MLKAYPNPDKKSCKIKQIWFMYVKSWDTSKENTISKNWETSKAHSCRTDCWLHLGCKATGTYIPGPWKTSL